MAIPQIYVSISTSGKLYLKDNSFPTLLGHLRVKMWKYAALVSWIFQNVEKESSSLERVQMQYEILMHQSQELHCIEVFLTREQVQLK